MAEFGANLKALRESKGLTLNQISGETRIAIRFLQALENDDFESLPGGVFSRGFVRAYAEVLGIDPEKTLVDFERASTYEVPPLVDVDNPRPDKSNRALYPIAVGILLVLVIIFYVVTKEPGVSVTANPQPIPPPTQTAATPSPEASAPSASQPTNALQPATVPNVQPPLTAKEVAPTKTSLTLDIDVQQSTWIKISIDGQPAVAGELLAAGTARRYTAETSIELVIGNATGVRIRVNDRPLRVTGKDGQVRTITITPENLKDLVS